MANRAPWDKDRIYVVETIVHELVRDRDGGEPDVRFVTGAETSFRFSILEFAHYLDSQGAEDMTHKRLQASLHAIEKNILPQVFADMKAQW